MVDLKVLEAFGTTNERLREIFTAAMNPEDDAKKPGETKDEKKLRLERVRKKKHDMEVKVKFERQNQVRIEEGIIMSIKNWRKYAAIDCAWDSAVINKMNLPLLMYAQGKINVERCAELLNGCKDGERFVKRDETTKQAKEIDIPRFVETQVNLIRSVITRRHSAQKNKYGNLWPFYEYQARSTGLPAKCRADVLSQRVDMMADQYGYRHHDEQVMRDAMLYAHSVDFTRRPWEVEKQYQRKSFDGGGKEVNTIIVKEGISWINPHPARVFWDNAHPLSSLNEDNGCKWVGFWDVLRFADVEDDPSYFNKTSIGWTGKFWGDSGIYNNYRDYFTNYTFTILPPQSGQIDPSKGNDRKATMGFYSGSQRDASIFVTNEYVKITPNDFDMGTYPFDVWMHLVVASNNTVIFAEWIPSTPCAVLSINESDARQVNCSMADDLMSYQDQMTNLLTHLLLLCQIELFKSISINTDFVTPQSLAEIRKQLKGKNWASDPLILEYSVLKMKEMGFDPKQVISIAETKVGASIDSIFTAIMKLVSLVERMIAMSPAEQGQPAPREISATEVTEISTTTTSVYSSISGDIDKFRAAKKRIIYESLITCQESEIVCPVKNRYTDKTIKAAGFESVKDEKEDFTGDTAKHTVTGSVRSLVHDYIFTTRDGDDRPVNTQSANTLIQLMGQVLAVTSIAQALGKEKLYDIFNEIFRMSGAGVDLNLTLQEGEDNSLGQSDIDALKQELQQVEQAMTQLVGQVKQNSQDIAGQEQVNQDQEQHIKLAAGMGDRMTTIAKDVEELQGKHSDIQKRLIETIPYDKSPPSIQRQIEQQAGFQPASDSERVPATNGKKAPAIS